ncbi:hypothetical protein FRC14_004832 [Serendipita sp. 396]|nr:hypothetical protein FRC14_004832 [Serendipita sp. 396]KAG8781524.1 hypothetical protein FRC15_008597 [Serendipita sp. 397]KAG8815794.1 hypothetical protein FRC18_001320 [Serendipita sp. 400]KAG8823538.1 hypothetical protein FRC19_003627 [Serendipita sp. 401]KAG8848137.1 hypothetical protein FRB91_011145 [Serendipita sp. 411]KAG8866423.1 hypothetical protein FRC20_008589 [Serendipita sp. 405]KAG9054694.1 hypothetical protein FS842_004441 [Serendipita sp. 407]
MNNQPQYVISRIPPEIWLEIFDHAIVPKYLANERYDGDDWICYAAEAVGLSRYGRVKQAEKQRKHISLVCKSWNQIAMSSKLLFLLFRESTAKPRLETVMKARYAYAMSSLSIPMGLAGCEVAWRALRIAFGQVIEQIRQVRCPNLRRLDIVYDSRQFDISDMDQLTETLEHFKDITWFGCWADDAYLTLSDPPESGQRITLRNLQSIHCISSGELLFPYYRLDLPALRHIYISARPRGSFPLPQLVELYGKTLLSLYLDIQPRRGLDPFIFDFSGWESIPHLQELAIEVGVCMKFDPLPPTHPLRVFAANLLDVNDLSSWLESENLKEVWSLHPNISEHPIDTRHVPSTLLDEIRILEEKAKLKGIKLQACRSADWKRFQQD